MMSERSLSNEHLSVDSLYRIDVVAHPGVSPEEAGRRLARTFGIDAIRANRIIANIPTSVRSKAPASETKLTVRALQKAGFDVIATCKSTAASRRYEARRPVEDEELEQTGPIETGDADEGLPPRSSGFGFDVSTEPGHDWPSTPSAPTPQPTPDPTPFVRQNSNPFTRVPSSGRVQALAPSPVAKSSPPTPGPVAKLEAPVPLSAGWQSASGEAGPGDGNLNRAIGFAVAGGLGGALIWALVAFITGSELGWLAWGIGALVGFCVRSGFPGELSSRTGVLAGAVAVGAILLGKWIAFSVTVEDVGEQEAIATYTEVLILERERSGQTIVWPDDDDGSFEGQYPEDVWEDAERWFSSLSDPQRAYIIQAPYRSYEWYFLSTLAAQIAMERTEAGQRLIWPLDAVLPWHESFYPEDVWGDAMSRYRLMSELERTNLMATADADMLLAYGGGAQPASLSVVDTLDLFDALFFFLAIGVAFRLGSSRVFLTD